MKFDPADKLILALDGMDQSEVFELIAKLNNLRWVKVGLELFISNGREIILALKDRGLRVFLDLKFHDIPITMAGACRQAASTGAELITVHACAGIDALKEANAAAAQGAKFAGFEAPTLLAVTVLTSWSSNKFANELIINQPLEKRVEYLAKLSFDAGIGGCICSPLEVNSLRRLFPEAFELVTPGIRNKGFEHNDQVRIMSPSDALKSGATRLVIGRPITQAKDPMKIFQEFCKEVYESQRD
ncbi:orotidine-5'-phosphate decarboxylase [Prochlorococcus sp. MIT 1307]|uniref:orotidine-5'-phosphate decarboxylase n=1 Tax=Prochlorococcus sp. MIT 1307 TaxID=3096219 RepID=UPI002A752EDC|nr:orotidine-5'-phosphate decarboxylase [Prochlorococcus sp. MIT 1307]